MAQKIQLSDHFTYGRLYRFVLPPIVMVIFTSLYTVVDGFFVSNFAGKTAFASLNIIFPFLMVLGAFGFMVGAGGSAIIAKKLGEGDRAGANSTFSMLVWSVAAGGVVLSAAGILLMRPVSVILGAEGGKLLDGCVLYGTIMTAAMPLFMLQNMFQSFFVAAEKPKTGLAVIILAGVTNMIGDAVLVGLFRLGLAGAAAASALGQAVGGLVPAIYFARKNGSLLKLGRAKFSARELLKTCTNGASELMSNISASVVSMLFNFRLIEIAGEDGVDAYGIIMYVCFIFLAVFFGFSIGSAPVFSFNLGAKNGAELKSLFKKSMLTVSAAGAIMTALSLALSGPLSLLFAGNDPTLAAMTKHGMLIYSLSYLFAGTSVFASALFTALGNGLISALLSFLRTLVLQSAAVLVFPLIISPPIDGVWLSVVVAELVSFILSLAFIFSFGVKYGYMAARKGQKSPDNVR